MSRAPWFTITTVVTLAIGIGACTAMFSIVQAVRLRPFGVGVPDQVVVMWPTSHGVPSEFPFAMLRKMRERRIRSANGFARASPGGRKTPIPRVGAS